MSDAAEAIDRGRQARRQRNFAAARKQYEAAATIYRNQNDPLACAHVLRHIADIYIEESHLEPNLQAAKPLYEEAIEIYRSNLQTRILDLANALRPYALLLEFEGDQDAARQLWQEARSLYASLRLDAGVNECNRHLPTDH